MARGVSEIIDDDDEISIIDATSFPVKKGTTKSDPISVEDYRLPKLKGVLIDSSSKSKRRSSFYDGDGDVQVLYSSFPKSRPRFFKGECSNSNRDDDGDVQVLYSSFPKSRTRFFKGECSNSKRDDENNKTLSIPIVPSTFLCEICADEKPQSENFRILSCDHSYCSDCIGKYVASKLQDNITSIDCPVPRCRGSLEPHHCRSILPKQVFDRWGDALCEALILATEKFYCPFKDCSALLVDDRNGGSGEAVIAESECPNCNRLFCGQCKVPWHSGIGCVEFQSLKIDERSREDIMLMNLAKGNKWMRCPACHFFVEKIEGCFFITCRCGYNFCYYCGAQNVKHFGHSCKQMVGLGIY